MEKVTPINEVTAEQQLRDEYKRVFGKKPDAITDMIIKSSAKRALAGETWRWVKDESNRNWSEQLHWG